jgi:hypothetical protein
MRLHRVWSVSRLPDITVGDQIPRAGLDFKQFSLDHTGRVSWDTRVPDFGGSHFTDMLWSLVPFGRR